MAQRSLIILPSIWTSFPSVLVLLIIFPVKNLILTSASATLIESDSASKANNILGSTRRSTIGISSDEQKFVPLAGFASVFLNSLLVFRGDTELFYFQSVSIIGIPFLHISHSSNQSFEVHIYQQTEFKSLLLSLCKSVRQQIIVIGISERTRQRYENKDGAPSQNEKKTILPLYPQVILAITTAVGNVANYLGYKEQGGLFRLLAKSGRLMTFLFKYDLKYETPAEAEIICHYCQYKSHMKESLDRITLKWSVSLYPQFSVSFRCEGMNIHAEMEKVRKNITDDGRNILWHLPWYLTRKYTHRQFVQGDEVIARDFGTGARKTLLGLEELEIAVVKVLFPLHQRTYSKTCELLTDCKFETNCQIRNRLLPCSNRGLIAYKSGPYDFPRLTFEPVVLTDHDVIFITSEGVMRPKSESTAYLFGVFDTTVWVVLSASLVITSIVYAWICVQEWQSPDETGYTNFNFIAIYFSSTLLGQFPRDLPIRIQGAFAIHSGKSQLVLFSWAFGTLFLRNWYTAYMKSSFNFPFPYELTMTGWRDFENFSLYLLTDEKKFSSNETKLFGDWSFYDQSDREKLLEDVQNFGSSIWDRWPLHIFYEPIHHDMMPREFSSFRNEACMKTYIRLRLGANLHPGSYEFRTIMNWMIAKRCLRDMCIKNLRKSNTGELWALCTVERKALIRMQYRMDIIDYTDLYMYVGQWYRNLTEQGRIVGLELIGKLGNRTVLQDETYREGLVKLNQTFRNEKQGLGNTLYWMLRRPEAAFVSTKAEFPWHWNQFKKLMKKDTSLRFAYTGSEKMSTSRTHPGPRGDGFESGIQIHGPWYNHMPELNWMKRRISALGHSGILGFLTKWDFILRPPIREKLNEFIEETVTGYQALNMQHESVKATFTVNFWLLGISFILFMLEIPILPSDLPKCLPVPRKSLSLRYLG